MEQRRQIIVMQENFRVLNRTAEIMNCSDPVYSNSLVSSKSTKNKELTSVTKKNIHVIFQWFIHKFGKYVPWWAHINY